jgi:hypothetical protein
MSESITVITLLLSALDRIDLQAVFDRDPYESRRRALPGPRLVKVLGDVAGARPGHPSEPSGIVHITIRLLLFVFYKKRINGEG